MMKSPLSLPSKPSRMPRFLSSAAVALSVAVALPVTGLALGGCKGGAESAASTPKAGEMPPGESWQGVYFHPIFGNLHLVEQGTNVVGRWKRADASAWGELEGTVEGNLVRYKWTEHKIGLVGASASSKGKGWFKYTPAKEEKGSAELDGKFGLDDAEPEADWHCVKQQRVTPDLDSVNGDTGGLAPPAGGGWQ